MTNVQVSARWTRSQRMRTAPSSRFTLGQSQAAAPVPAGGTVSQRTRGSSGAPVRQR
ncbi:MAG: hypothetical protein WAK82_06105 [Streptosporangiaceae bacterium]